MVSSQALIFLIVDKFEDFCNHFSAVIDEACSSLIPSYLTSSAIFFLSIHLCDCNSHDKMLYNIQARYKIYLVFLTYFDYAYGV